MEKTYAWISEQVEATKSVIEHADQVRLSAQDSLRVFGLLEHPPAPDTRLRSAAGALPRRS
jgi:uncharacterized protein (DUF1778 family)